MLSPQRATSGHKLYIAEVDFDEIRRLIITALFSDDELYGLIVLKGGNAISLVYGYSTRGSLDLDFSIEQDFVDLDHIRGRIFRALTDRFSSVGITVFDAIFKPKPLASEEERWGGYELTFKLIEARKYSSMQNDDDALRRNALEVGPAHLRSFRVEMSKFEYCAGKAETELDAYSIYVYTPAMIVIEKLRAICQQMPEYALNRHPHARARDFYDIHTVIANAHVRIGDPKNVELARQIFLAKEVPPLLIGKIGERREFHRPDWPAVRASVLGAVSEFDFYFDFVVAESLTLQSLWVG